MNVHLRPLLEDLVKNRTVRAKSHCKCEVKHLDLIDLIDLSDLIGHLALIDLF